MFSKKFVATVVGLEKPFNSVGNNRDPLAYAMSFIFRTVLVLSSRTSNGIGPNIEWACTVFAFALELVMVLLFRCITKSLRFSTFAVACRLTAWDVRAHADDKRVKYSSMGAFKTLLRYCVTFFYKGMRQQ